MRSEQRATDITHLFFDLDDTLVDTSRHLVEPALRQSYQVFCENGLNLKFDDFLTSYRKFKKQNTKQSFFAHISEAEGIAGAKEAADIFYSCEITTALEPFPGAREVLAQLSTKHTLFLVTFGHPGKQAQKVRLLDIGGYFKGIHYVNRQERETKFNVFEKIIKELEILPENVLCVGNRLDDEILAGNQLGCKTCWVRHAEYAPLTIENPEEEPTYTISHIRLLREACGL